ncbi:MAG: flagellar filament capping protein FliD [Pseudomonadota bacterium]
MALSSPGIGSGLDVNGLVSQLMALERRPLAALDKREAEYQAKLSAYGTLKGALSSFQATLKNLSSAAAFAARKATIAKTDVATVSASNSAVPGNYTLDVTALAKAHAVRSSGTFSSTSATIGTGTITIAFGTFSGGTFTVNGDRPAQTIAIGTGDGTLSGIRDAINNANAGVNASIVNDGSGYRLVIASKFEGTKNSLKITVSDDDGTHTDMSGLSQLAYDPAAAEGSGKNLKESIPAQDATLSVNGVSITSASNVLTDVIEGVTLTLTGTTGGTPTTVTVAKDISTVKTSIEAFVKGYNDLVKTVKSLSAYNAETKQASILTGDATLRGVETRLRDALNTALRYAGGGLTTLSEVGIAFQKDGTLALDGAKLQKAFDDSTKDVSTLFASVGKPTDSLIKFISATTTAEAGAYEVNITTLASQGKAVGAVTLGGTTTITTGSNDTLTVVIDGVTATVTLAAGGYTPAQMAAEIQAKINGASAISAAGAGVTVTQSGGVLTITSNRYGSTSSATVSGGTAQATLFGTTTDTAGVDVAGSLGGVTGTGIGQRLTAAGISVDVEGSTTGTRGTLNFAQGFAVQLDKLIDKMLAADDILAARTGGIDDEIAQIGKRREELNRRLEIIEKRFRTQFSALDSMIASMTRTSNFLQQQIANLPKSNK